MAEINPPFALQNAGATHTALGDRFTIAGLIAGQGPTSFSSRGGVNMALGTEFVVNQTGTPSMSIEVGSGVCYVPGSEASAQGVYCCINDNMVTKTVTAAHGTLPRIDSVIARVYDSAFSGATNAWAIEVIAGTAASSPTAPALPANSLRLYNINVGAAVSSITNANLVDVRAHLAAAGGIISCTSSDMPSLASVPEGQGIWLRNLGILQFKFGGAWVTRSASNTTQSGSASVTFSSKSVHTQSVTFPTAFTSTPRVFVNIANTAGVTAGWISRGYNISSTGFTLYLAQVNGVTVNWGGVEVQWFATL